MSNICDCILALIGSALTGKACEVPHDTDWVSVFKASYQHKILPIVYYGIINSSLEFDAKEIFLDNTLISAYNQHVQLLAYEEISKKFAKNSIDHIPLKGAVVKDLYPKSEMRVMGDIDILVKEDSYDSACAVMEKLGYTKGDVTENVTAYVKKPNLCFEIHKHLVSNEDTDYADYLYGVWDRALATDKEHIYKLSNEDLLIFIFLHLTKHYKLGGIGFRQLVDIHIIRTKINGLNIDYIKKNFAELGVLKFFENIIYMLDVWFENAPNNKISEFLTKQIYTSGAYGSVKRGDAAIALKNIINNGSSNNSFKKVISIAFLPLKNMKDVFPILNKMPFLLPVMWAVRWFKILIFKPNNIKRQKQRIENSTNKEVEKYINELNYVGLDVKIKN